MKSYAPSNNPTGKYNQLTTTAQLQLGRANVYRQVVVRLLTLLLEPWKAVGEGGCDDLLVVPVGVR